MSRIGSRCEVHDHGCEVPVDDPNAPLVRCWGCGHTVCRSCSSIVKYRFMGKNRPKRFCNDCQRERKIGIGEAVQP